MKHSLFVILITIISFNTQGQNISVTYSRVNNIEKQLDIMEKQYKHLKSDIRNEMAEMMNEDMTFVLQHSEGYSKFKMLENEDIVSRKELNVGGNSIVVIFQKSKLDPHIYKSIRDNLSWNQTDLFGKGFIILDSISFEWEFHTDRKQIGDYDCNKATVIHNGLAIEAWYSEDIPIFDGPDIYSGLPGLILELKSPKFNFSALDITVSDEEFDLVKPSGYPEMNRAEFEKEYQKRMKSLYPPGSNITKY
jgi:GLPGLI family protein